MLERIAEGKGKWDSTLQEELAYIISDFHTVGFSETTIKKVLEQQYKMLDGLKIKYTRLDVDEYLKNMKS